jgi:hypothetical protein
MHMGFTLCATVELERDYAFAAPAVSAPATLSMGFTDNAETGSMTSRDVNAGDADKNKPSS